MMTRIHGTIHFECDGCGEVLDTDARDFDEARSVLSGNDWRAQKVGDVWLHHCPPCQPAKVRT